MNITIKRIGADAAADVNIPNQPFPLFGRMCPRYDGEWSYGYEYFDGEITSMTFPDENYDYTALAADCFFVGAYADGVCVGLAIYKKSWNNYLYLYDLKVNADYRRHGIGKLLIGEGKKLAAENGYGGIYTQGQDNNLGACLFYIGAGFVIGGLDTVVYAGTNQSGKSDIIFYLNL